MKKIILFLALCWCFTAAEVSAQVDTQKYGKVVLLSQQAADGNLKYGLKLNKKKLLPIRYNLTLNDDLQIMAFYADHDIYLYDAKGNLIVHHTVEFKFDKDASVEFEQVKDRADVPCFEMKAYYFSNNWVFDRFGTFFVKGGHLYRISRPKVELMN